MSKLHQQTPRPRAQSRKPTYPALALVVGSVMLGACANSNSSHANDVPLAGSVPITYTAQPPNTIAVPPPPPPPPSTTSTGNYAVPPPTATVATPPEPMVDGDMPAPYQPTK